MNGDDCRAALPASSRTKGWIVGNENSNRQVVVNLLANSAGHTPPGTPTTIPLRQDRHDVTIVRSHRRRTHNSRQTSCPHRIQRTRRNSLTLRLPRHLKDELPQLAAVYCAGLTVERRLRDNAEAYCFDSAVTQPHRPSAGAPIILDTLHAAIGRTSRDDPGAPRTGGPAGNARLTAWTGLVLLALSVAELVTLIDVGRLISWHIAIGTLLIPPALLKTVSTGWRIGRYYRRNPDYRHAGPPPTLLRILGPGVVASTLGLLGSGVVLILIGQDNSRAVLITALGQRVDWLTLHQGLFIIWAVLTGLHLLARLVPALQLTVMTRRPTSIDGSGLRAAALGAAIVLAVISAILLLAAADSWKHDDHHRRPRTSGVVEVFAPLVAAA